MAIDLTISVLTVPDLEPALRGHFSADATRGAPWLFSQHREVPSDPGVYVWADPRGAVLYIGSAASLRQRLGREQGWVSAYEPAESWAVSVVHMLKHHQAEAWWVPTADLFEARELERRLIEWHRAVTGNAPPAAGWDAKKGSLRERAQSWAQGLWRTHFG
ncbi:GIY-YIG nuclease family protein [Streptomyces sp. NPDC014735]|uniref:GIY-YIG nuclease family protein n=1 Tax=Streptomyces sp. NPDC014735 TaxID=3364887 RepID=UPI0036F88C52